MSPHALLGFMVAIIPLVVTPGASFTLATQHTLSGRSSAAAWVVAGTATGIFVHASLAAAGLSAVVMQSAVAFTVVKVVGGCYLIALGAWMIWTKHEHREPPKGISGPAVTSRGRPVYVQAFLANVLNPKAAAIYLTLAPQFLAAHQVSPAPMMLMASGHVVVMALWLVLWTSALRRGKRLVGAPRFSTYINRVGGAVLIALGVRTVVV